MVQDQMNLLVHRIIAIAITSQLDHHYSKMMNPNTRREKNLANSILLKTKIFLNLHTIKGPNI